MPVKPPLESQIVLGVMSGTSLDGLDLALVRFKNNCSEFELIDCATEPYPSLLQSKLKTAISSSSLELAMLDIELGKYIGGKVHDFLKRHTDCRPHLVSSHGHTIFHQPQNGLTLQIGSGQHIATNTQITTICDFRTKDVALGGQGAPLVPIGDLLLFPEFKHCINIGGIANISTKSDGLITSAFDICVGNLALNYIAQKEGSPYDKGGGLAKDGKVIPKLLTSLNSLPYLLKQPPKSLGFEDIKRDILSVLEHRAASNQDILRTLVEHIAVQIAHQISGSTLITGGGAHNTYLIQRIKELTSHEVVVPNKSIVDFKEAIIFALLGALFFEGKTNVLSIVTGSEYDHSGGILYTP